MTQKTKPIEVIPQPVNQTRAQDVLHLFGSGHFPFLEELQKSERLDVV